MSDSVAVVAFGTFVGYLAGALVKVIFICVMAGFFIASLF